ncbi:MAG TPA: nucleoside triphosphate pyrophosphohydrolase [Halieaceae bacterium]|jgi:ATP diphosphatase|uniref:nucleoside triphosphate pyrophosphohydrolase n=1 Tax=Haliea TaxID=475794 RepID=UPI000C4BB9E9|nr:nucleoside triphosphate pyrophosphohydrolase [Haliea sp.]HBM82613.1 nucleoside triphosphate pyrophosphohydrolase [Halieaceae bacterium]MAD63420.1 nucleoside triphosphate pyrophosphohydrolase [Haliea sp.]MAY93512.1 nucleoside triphosphate pyrophosphohydrolase [Haliea sp.]MBK41271.1 nucleoside triphosphate pyrophosphohydrolase [Haliea sp.]MBP71828.1 nucleoside triphosphate pyrophosphohydrolase [Haliea sp.]
MSTTPYTLADLLRVMQRLRDPEGGCPWDLQQDFRSIVPSTLEECYELASAIEHGDYPHVAEELGDVLFQVVFYAQLGREQGLFSFEEIVHTLVDKLLRRHPHVFAAGEIEGRVDARHDVAEVKRSWEAIKREERAARAQRGIMDDVPVALPALPRAQKLQKRAALVGFDWPDAPAVLDKLDEERGELQEAMAAGDAAAVADEMGDLLFTCVNLARRLGLDAEATLRAASAKFERRFRVMEAALAEADGRGLAALTSEELEALWVAAKARA